MPKSQKDLDSRKIRTSIQASHDISRQTRNHHLPPIGLWAQEILCKHIVLLVVYSCPLEKQPHTKSKVRVERVFVVYERADCWFHRLDILYCTRLMRLWDMCFLV